jgi:L-arabinokinase
MGGIADYSGSLVLEMPIRERTTVEAVTREDGIWRVLSSEARRLGFKPVVEARTKDLSTPLRARRFFARDPKASWAAYVLGCVPFLLDKGMPPHGADLHLSSDIPLAKGLSSSAAAEVAAMNALGRLFGLRFGKTKLPILCQKVENLVVGAPCGLMDQLTCHLGRKDRLLPILCRPDRVRVPVPIPEGIRFIGVDSGVRHWVGGSSYIDVRTAAFMGYSLIALREGATKKDLRKARETKDASRLPYGGYLARISPEVFEKRYANSLPENMSGRVFLQMTESIDPVTKVHPKSTYRIKACTTHPVYENFRVALFRKLLGEIGGTKKREKRRELLMRMRAPMFGSHASYGSCGLGEPVTDALVEAVREAGPEAAVYGAKITGGGSGGTVCVLAEGPKGLETVRAIASRVLKKKNPFLSIGSSDGACFS